MMLSSARKARNLQRNYSEDPEPVSASITLKIFTHLNTVLPIYIYPFYPQREEEVEKKINI